MEEFISWTLSHKNLKASTVTSYISSLIFIHNLNGLDSKNCNGFRAKLMLRGAENLEFYKSMAKGSRRVMTLPLLKILGHQIAKSDWSNNSKQVFWAALTLAFYGSFRFGELLGAERGRYNPSETLLWSDLNFRSDSVVIRVKIPKSRSPLGEHVDLFKIGGTKCCPVLSLLRLKNMSGKNMEGPVFKFDNGTLLTSKILNETLYTLLFPHIGEKAAFITGHSFRAALPSALANRPDLASEEDIKLWGRWDSTSFKKYTRLKPMQKKNIFLKIVSSFESL